MNRKKLEVIIGFLTLVISFFAWMSVKNAVIVTGSSIWGIPMLLFSIYLVLICLDIFIFRNNVYLNIVLFSSLFLSLIIVFAWLQFFAVIVAGYLLFLASQIIRRDIELNIKISPWKSLQTGKTYLLIAISLVITMQYFIIMSSFDGEKTVPYFDASFITKKIAIPFLSSVNPQFKALKDETLTVDQFILQTQNSNQDNTFSALDEETLDAQLSEKLTPLQREMVKIQARNNFSNTQSQIAQKNQELMLIIGRKQLSETIGVPVVGSEKISDVFTGLISNRINAYFNPKIVGEQKNSVFSLILAIVLFLIIYPLGLILLIFVFLIAKLLISGLFKANVLKIAEITVLKEIIE